MNHSKRFLLSIVLLILTGTFAQSAWGQDTTPEATPAISYPTQGELYSLMTFPVIIDPAAYSNPFDIADIQLLGIFQPPSGQQIVVQGFWMQAYEDHCQQPCTVENLQSE